MSHTKDFARNMFDWVPTNEIEQAVGYDLSIQGPSTTTRYCFAVQPNGELELVSLDFGNAGVKPRPRGLFAWLRSLFTGRQPRIDEFSVVTAIHGHGGFSTTRLQFQDGKLLSREVRPC